MIFFDWLRRRTCNAILGGVSDAADAIANGVPEVPDLAAALAKRFALPAPAPADAPAEPTEATSGRRKGRQET